MSIGIAEAEATAKALRVASETPGILRNVREELAARAEEWERAVTFCMEYEGEGTIEMCTAVTRGMRVLHDRHGFCRVLRKINDGLSLMMESPDSPQGWWRNFIDVTSPVVVRT